MVIYNGLDIDETVKEIRQQLALGRQSSWYRGYSVAGVKYLDHGSSKVVFLLPDGNSVLKLDISTAKKEVIGSQTSRELETWAQAPSHICALLAQVLEFGSDWIISERADPPTYQEYERDSALHEVCKRLANAKFADICCDNLGKRANGTYCMTDYGYYNSYCSDSYR